MTPREAGKTSRKPASGRQDFAWRRLVVSGGRAFRAAASVLDSLEDFFAMNRHGLRRVDANPDLVSLHTKYRDRHVFANDNRLADSSRQNQHGKGPPPSLFVYHSPFRTPAYAAEWRRNSNTVSTGGHAISSHKPQDNRRSECRHLTQDSSADSGTRTAILISEVEMSSAFTPCRARDSKSCAATPACERIPTPTMASFATLSSPVMRAPGNSV